MQDIQVPKTQEIQELRETLSRLASMNAASFSEGGVVHTERDKENDRVLEEFRFCNLSVCRIKYKELDYNAKRPYATSALAQRIKAKMEAQVLPAPSLELIHWFMTKILQSNKGKVEGKAQKKWYNLRIAAQERLWVNREHREDDIAEMLEGNSDKDFLAYLADVKKNLKRISNDDFQRFGCLKSGCR